MSDAIREHVNIIRSVFVRQGSADYIGEAVSQLEHASQAAQLAQQEGYQPDIILAAFLHDVGHLLGAENANEMMGPYGSANHENIAAEFLHDLGFSDKICRLVQGHVATKRYLTYRYPEYFEQLSEASRATLQHQGGSMNETEAAQYEADPLFALHLKMREWDDKAKEVGVPLIDLEYIFSMAEQHLINEHTM